MYNSISFIIVNSACSIIYMYVLWLQSVWFMYIQTECDMIVCSLHLELFM